MVQSFMVIFLSIMLPTPIEANILSSEFMQMILGASFCIQWLIRFIIKKILLDTLIYYVLTAVRETEDR